MPYHTTTRIDIALTLSVVAENTALRVRLAFSHFAFYTTPFVSYV